MSVAKLVDHLESDLARPDVLNQLTSMIAGKSSTAGTRPEEVFTREFLCPSIADFFYRKNRDPDLSDHGIQCGLGTEGYKNAAGFGFTPAREQRHLFTKSEFVMSEVPASWLQADKPTRKQACPDFAIADPLPLSVVGEVKFYNSESPAAAIKELYDAARQAVFYLGAFGSTYSDALIVVADAYQANTFISGLKQVNPGILSRFGEETRVHLAVISLH